jgi:hypothetical protein
LKKKSDYQARVKEIIQIAKNELNVSLEQLLGEQKKSLGDNFKMLNTNELTQDILIHARLLLVPSIIHIVHKVFEEEHIREIIQSIQDIYDFINKLSYLKINPLVNRFIYQNPQGFKPDQLKDILHWYFPVPNYLKIFSIEDHRNIFTSLADDSWMSIVSYRTTTEFEQDREIFAYARDIEAKVLEQMLYPTTEKDLIWIKKRLEEWDTEIMSIHNIEKEVINYRKRLYLEARDSFYHQAFTPQSLPVRRQSYPMSQRSSHQLGRRTI